jgi:hypothetical protein
MWERHFSIELNRKTGFDLTASPDALVAVNGHTVQQAVLKNGDMIEAGAVQLQFWLSATQQYPLKFRERLTWVLLAGLFAGQIALIYWLLQ